MTLRNFNPSYSIPAFAFLMIMAFVSYGSTSALAEETLDQFLNTAMDNNPDIMKAKAKVALAEAELNATRLQVAGKIITLWNNRVQQNTLVQKDEQTNASTSGAISAKELTENKGKLIQLDTELHYLVGKNELVKSPEKITQEQPKPVQIPSGPIVDKLRSELPHKNIDLEFVETPLSQVIDYLNDFLKFQYPIYLDRNPLNEIGINSETPITMTMHKTPLAAALQAFQDQNQGTQFVVRDYGILLTTIDQAKEQGYYPALDFARSIEKEKITEGKPATALPATTPSNPAK